MFDIGFMELLVLAIIGMVVIGPERLPGAARTVGRTVGQLRRFLGNLQNQLEQEVKMDELNKKIMEETKGQTFRNNDESQASAPFSESADTTPAPAEAPNNDVTQKQHPSQSEPPSDSENTSRNP